MDCEYCGNLLILKDWEKANRSNKILRRFCNRRCANKIRGVNPATTKYQRIKVNGKNYQEHRVIMENFLGRKLESWEHVHHIDENKLNNDISNLKLVTRNTHRKEHSKYPLTKICVICSCEFMPEATKRRRKKTCSKDCRYKLNSLTYHKNRACLPNVKKRSKS